jgi:hypothetical protein
MEQSRRKARRRTLAAIAALGAGGISGYLSRALAAGDKPIASAVNRLEGTATVNGVPAKVGTPVKVGDRVVTGPKSQAVIVVGTDAFLLRENTTLEIKGTPEGGVAEMLVTAGRILSVFGKKPVKIRAQAATIGIRGTGAYLEVEPNEVYFCLCYGDALIEGPGMAPKEVKTKHHEQPLLIDGNGVAMTARPGPFRNHKDDELILLESLCGREPPFVKDGQYPANKYL